MNLAAQNCRGDIESVGDGVDFAALYDAHPEYVARRMRGSFEQAQIDIEVALFKQPHLMGLLRSSQLPASVLEIGCATGELINAIPVLPGGRKLGIDISAANIASAQARFPDVEFQCGDFRFCATKAFDVVILSDVLEHVPDDQLFLRDAAAMGQRVLVNLPLEDNWLNRNRAYGPEDVSGHLRSYSLAEGLALFHRAGLQVTGFSRVWIHETDAELARRALRLERTGALFSGGWFRRTLKRILMVVARTMPFLGRRLFASNLFVAARRPIS